MIACMLASVNRSASLACAFSNIYKFRSAANTMTEETYRATHAELCSRFEETEAKLAALQKQRDKMKAEAITIGGMMFELGELDSLPVVFDEKLWHGTIDHVTVYADKRMVFYFKDGKEIVTRL